MTYVKTRRDTLAPVFLLEWNMGVRALSLGAVLIAVSLSATAQQAATPYNPAKGPRTAADQKPQPYPLTNFYKPPPTPTEVGRTTRPHAYLYAPCLDAKVASLAGMPREAALAKVRTMNLMQVRVLALETPVTYERVPERLTLIVTAAGKVSRAFCR